MEKQDSSFWKRKLVAFLHDPPCKALDIKNHEEDAKTFINNAGLNSEILKSFSKEADFTASASDRFSFPKSSQLKSQCKIFKHTFGGDDLEIKEINIKKVFENLSLDQNLINEELRSSLSDYDIVNFFIHWRFWQDKALDSNNKINYLPADTRIPDHTIWNHMALTSAFQACMEEGNILKPTFLVFQLGPVQSLISQARSTRDLWSGSYLLSWLTGIAIKSVTDALGPDNIISPSVRGVGVFDLLHRESIYEKAEVWDFFYNKISDLLTPSLPNKFLALVPSGKAKELALNAEKSVKEALKEIGEDCWKWIQKEASAIGENSDNWKVRWNGQLERAITMSWQIMPWEEDIEFALKKFQTLPVGKLKSNKCEKTISESLEALYKLVTQGIPEKDRDHRYFTNSEKRVLNNSGFAWPYHYSITDFAHSARRNTREFQSNSFEIIKLEDNKYKNLQDGAVKDSLSGQEESIGSEKFWKHLSINHNKIFKAESHRLGALNLLKKLWCLTPSGYLFKKSGFNEKEFSAALKYESVEDITNKGIINKNYIAILMIDGDEMGKWISGAKNLLFKDVISEDAKGYFSKIKQEASNNDIKKIIDEALNSPRPLSPSFHLQFSEAISNYSRYVVNSVVDSFDGQLIYSGGDDVLAMVPAENALKCAHLLRSFFKGEKPNKVNGIEVKLEGWLSIEDRYFMMPGKNADVSCGICIGHKNAPLQMLINKAKEAEQHAKHKYDRGAFSMFIYKRGGEISTFGAKWDSGAVSIWTDFQELIKNKIISSRFAYALNDYTKYYKLDDVEGIRKDFPAKEILIAELDKVGERQTIKKELEKQVKDFLGKCEKYLDFCETNKRPFSDINDLLLSATFLNRDKGGRE
ncbi:MAG: Crispr-associated protein Crm2 family protein [uncultured bacterium]|nr:MAG: Crispr-associated protein Crm2 family protein [uncultured bacterium]